MKKKSLTDFVSISREQGLTYFGVLVSILVVILAICYAGHLQVSMINLYYD